VVGAPEILFRNPTPERSWQPFSDLFVTEFVSRAVWIFENIAAQAMNLWIELQTLPKVLGVPPHDPRLLATRRKIMEEYKWTDAAGRPLTELPFILRYRDGETAAWPPLTSRNLTRISGLIHRALYRSAFKRDCRSEGYTYPGVQRPPLFSDFQIF
jgi:hypothetical protein